MKLNSYAAVLVRGSGRIAPKAHPPLPPFDPNDAYGLVHTTLPPEQVIPPHFTDPCWMRADFNGVTLDMGRWKAKPLPFLVGANSTPLSMLMTPMLALYPAYWQEACLTEHAERGYDDFIVSHEPWNAAENGVEWSPAKLTRWLKQVKAWGFRTVLWYGGRPPDAPDTYVKMAFDAGVVDFLIWGKEVESQMSSAAYEASLQAVDRYVGGRVPIGAHFSADGNRKMGYPQSAPDYLRDWSPYNGRVHLMQQLDVRASAGLQGASMWYGRRRVALGAAAGEGGLGLGAPDSRVIAFETMATAQLYGQCDEGYGCLRDWELICGTRDTSNIRPVSGFGNGCRRPNGDPL